METIIVICLLLVIALLLEDKILIGKKKDKEPKQEKRKEKLPEIMGPAKPLKSLIMPKGAAQSQNKMQEKQSDNFDLDIYKESPDIQIAQEEPDDVFRNIPDLEQEEEEWNRYGFFDGDDGFAQGVTFEELSSVGMLLQKENLQASQKETAAAIIHKIQGTELFSLLENSMEGASRKIAALLDSSLSSENENGSSHLWKNDLRDFNIGDFV